MKCCRFSVLFVAILLLIEGYDGVLPPLDKLQIQNPNDQSPGVGARQPAHIATNTPLPQANPFLTTPHPQAYPIWTTPPPQVNFIWTTHPPQANPFLITPHPQAIPIWTTPYPHANVYPTVPVPLPNQGHSGYNPNSGYNQWTDGAPQPETNWRSIGPTNDNNANTYSEISPKSGSGRACTLPKRNIPRLSKPDATSTENRYGEDGTRIVLEKQSKRCKGGNLYDIGYYKKSESPEAESKFVKVYEVCYGPYEARTIYAHAKILPGPKLDRTNGRHFFATFGTFHAIDMGTIYKRKNEQRTVASILGSKKLAHEKITTHEQDPFYLARGHLIAKIDLMDPDAQIATNTYMNAVPMWQNINDGNWRLIESIVRKLNNQKDCELEVWTGGIGTLTFPDENGQQKEIYLYVRGDVRKVPVPKFLFKVVYNRAAKSGIVFVTINNPYVKTLTEDLKICPDVCKERKWFPETWEPSMEGRRGLTYCCEIDAFRKGIRNFPVEIPKFTTETLMEKPQIKGARFVPRN